MIDFNQTHTNKDRYFQNTNYKLHDASNYTQHRLQRIDSSDDAVNYTDHTNFSNKWTLTHFCLKSLKKYNTLKASNTGTCFYACGK